MPKQSIQLAKGAKSAASPRIYAMPFAKVYPLYIQKAQKKGRSKEEVDAIIHWLTGHNADSLAAQLARQTSFADFFFAQAPALNPLRLKVTGVVCGVRVETLAEGTMREIRILDKLIDELARGKPMHKILRSDT